MTLDETLAQAMDSHRAGRAAEAEGLYRQVLAEQPDHHAAMNLLGALALQCGKYSDAAALLKRATEINPAIPEYHVNLGAALDYLGRLDEAAAAYRAAIAVKPDSVNALSNLSNVLRRQGKITDAIALGRRAVAAKGTSPEAHNNLGLALVAAGEFDKAIDSHARAANLRPSSADFMHNLGVALLRGGRVEDAIGAYRKALALSPIFTPAWCSLAHALNTAGKAAEAMQACEQALTLEPNSFSTHQEMAKLLFDQGKYKQSVESYRRALQLGDTPELHNNFGAALLASHDLPAAERAFRRAVELRPDYSLALNNLGAVVYAQGDTNASISYLRRAIEIAPNSPDSHNNLGTSLKYLGRFDEAAAHYARSVELRPEHGSSRWNLGLLYLTRGDFKRGWPNYEWRWRVPELRPPKVNFTVPRWEGADISGKRILLYTEQGFGDAIQFVRYVPMVRDRGAHVFVRCQAELKRLFETVAGADAVFAMESALPEFDFHCALMSLPSVFQTELAGVPAKVPYLATDPKSSAHWRERLAADSRKKIGIAWAGRPTHPKDRDRTIALEKLAPILATPDIQFLSLQKGAQVASAQGLLDWTAEFTDFAETAALIENLDLVVTVDTAVAHLAGALGKPVWVLLPWISDWRWMRDRDDSPWYPTMRLFRQPSTGDWASVIQRVAAELGRV